MSGKSTATSSIGIGLPYFRANAAAARHAGADPAVAGVEQHRQPRLGEHFVERVGDAIVRARTAAAADAASVRECRPPATSRRASRTPSAPRVGSMLANAIAMSACSAANSATCVVGTPAAVRSASRRPETRRSRSCASDSSRQARSSRARTGRSEILLRLLVGGGRARRCARGGRGRRSRRARRRPSGSRCRSSFSRRRPGRHKRRPEHIEPQHSQISTDQVCCGVDSTAMNDAITLKRVTKTFGSTKAVAGSRSRRSARRAVRLHRPERRRQDHVDPDDHVDPVSGLRRAVGARPPSALEAKDRIGYLPEERGVYRKMRVGAFLTFMARLKGVPEGDIAGAHRAAASSASASTDTERKHCEELSKGMQQKMQFIAAIIHEPDLLILDEPFSGLDPVSTRQLRELVLAEHARGATILFSTHVMPHAEEICDHVVMIHRGRKVLDEPVSRDPATATIRATIRVRAARAGRGPRRRSRGPRGRERRRASTAATRSCCAKAPTRRARDAAPGDSGARRRASSSRGRRLEDVFVQRRVARRPTDTTQVLLARRRGFDAGDCIRRRPFIDRGSGYSSAAHDRACSSVGRCSRRLFNPRNFTTSRARSRSSIPTGGPWRISRTRVIPRAHRGTPRAEQARQVLNQAPRGARGRLAGNGGREPDAARWPQLGSAPEAHLIERPPDADVQQEKAWLPSEEPSPRTSRSSWSTRDAVVPPAGRRAYGSYDLYVPPQRRRPRREARCSRSLREAIISARVRRRGLDRATIDALVRVARVPVGDGDARTASADGAGLQLRSCRSRSWSCCSWA